MPSSNAVYNIFKHGPGSASSSLQAHLYNSKKSGAGLLQIMNVEKLQKMAGTVRTGGKGTVRRSV